MTFDPDGTASEPCADRARFREAVGTRRPNRQPLQDTRRLFFCFLLYGGGRKPPFILYLTFLWRHIIIGIKIAYTISSLKKGDFFFNGRQRQ